MKNICRTINKISLYIEKKKKKAETPGWLSQVSV